MLAKIPRSVRSIILFDDATENEIFNIVLDIDFSSLFALYGTEALIWQNVLASIFHCMPRVFQWVRS